MSFRARAETWFESKSSGAHSVDSAMGLLPSISGAFSVEEYQLLESRASFGDIKTNDIKRHQKTSETTSKDIKRHLQCPPTSVTRDACLISKESVSNMIISDILVCDNAI